MDLKRSIFVLITGSSLLFTGCATKKYVRNEVSPVINKTNELDDITARNSKDIREVDTRATSGIQDVNARASAADQKAAVAGQKASEAQTLASNAAMRADTLNNTVANLDSYKPVVETSVHFGFDKAVLSKKAKKALDELAKEVPNTKGYIIEVQGATDSVGNPNYNYQLSERRAQAVIQYLAQTASIPAHKIYVIGLGKDKAVASNRSSSGRAQNRRVEVRLMTNTGDANATTGQVQKPS